MKVSVRRWLPLLVLVTVVIFAAVLYTRPGGDFVTRSINDISQAVAAFLGGAACWWRSRRSTGRFKLSWRLIAVALLCWAGGEVVWSYYEVFARRETPFPSVADVGFLLLPALALPGLLVRPSQAFVRRARIRVLLDGAMIAGSLFTLSWATSLGAVWDQGAQSPFAFTVSLAYPAGDVLMATVAVSVLAHTKRQSGLPVLVLGLVALGVADSGFVYLVATDNYNVVSYPDVAWVAAFLLIGASALSRREGAIEVEQRTADADEAQLGASGFLVLPYVVVLVGVAAQIAMFVDGRVTTATLVVQGAAMCALFLRQLLVVTDNRRMAMDIVAQQAQLRFRAFHDALTSLANRALFRDRVGHALDLHRRHERGVAVVLIDLDDFKAVNDSFGHHAGDALLVAVGERLVNATRSADTVARLGGDEFAVLCEDEVDVDALAARLLEALSAQPVVVAGRTMTVRASLGTASVRAGDETPTGEELLKRADIAMYVAKQAGKAMAVAFSPTLAMTGPDDLDERFALVDDIRDGRLDVAIQPMVRSDGSRFAFEALARWQRDGIDVAPEHFVPLAERAGMLPDLDLFVARRAITWLATEIGTSVELPVSINLGLPTLRRHDLVDQLTGMLADHGLEPSRLMIEIPEGRAIAASDVVATIEQLRALGVLIAVDDFGIGYSNLAQLAALMPDVIKFDKSLIRALGRQTVADRLLAGAIDLAHDLGALVVAEGVENPRQHAVLVALGCDAMQGFLLGRPVTVAADATSALAVVA